MLTYQATALPIWQQQLLDRATVPAMLHPAVVMTTPPSVLAALPPRGVPLPAVLRSAPDLTPDISGGVTINPNPPAGESSGTIVNDVRTTPTPRNPISGAPQPAPTSAVLQAPPGGAAATFTAIGKLTRQEKIALAVLAALVIL